MVGSRSFPFGITSWQGKSGIYVPNFRLKWVYISYDRYIDYTSIVVLILRDTLRNRV